MPTFKDHRAMEWVLDSVDLKAEPSGESLVIKYPGGQQGIGGGIGPCFMLKPGKEDSPGPGRHVLFAQRRRGNSHRPLLKTVQPDRSIWRGKPSNHWNGPQSGQRLPKNALRLRYEGLRIMIPLSQPKR